MGIELTKRNFGLDVARAVSISLVVIAHHFRFNVELGIVGVQFFFVLSGLLIGQILLREFERGTSFLNVLNFWKRRWFRTLPMYYLVLTLKIIFFGNPYGLKILVYYFFLQANFIGIDFFPVSWSLIVEEWFYIFLPLALFIPFTFKINSRQLIWVLITLVAFFLACRFFWNYLHKGVIIYQFECLLLGVILATVKLYFNPYYKKLNSLPLFLIGVTGVIGLTFVLGDMNKIPLFSPFYRVVWYFLISLFVSFIIPFLEMSSFINVQIKSIKPIYIAFTWTSILTYSIYLIHGDIFRISFTENTVLNTITHFVLMYGIAFILFLFYEHPMMSLRDRFSFSMYTDSVKSLLTKV